MYLRFGPLLTPEKLSLISPESHIVPLTEVTDLGHKMLKVTSLSYRSQGYQEIPKLKYAIY